MEDGWMAGYLIRNNIDLSVLIELINDGMKKN